MNYQDQKLVSVLMPVYNAEMYLANALESMLNQTSKNLEVIIVDDGSSDASMEVVNSFADPRVIVLKNARNQGLAAAVNQAIRVSKGTYLVRMDADDISKPDRLEKQVAFMDSHPDIDILGTSLAYFGDSTYEEHFPESHEGCAVRLLFNVCCGHPAVMFRRRVFNKSENLYDSALRQYSEEYDLWCRLICQYRFANLSEPLVYYRTYAHGIKHDAENLRRMNSVNIRRRYLEDRLGKVTDEEFKSHMHLAQLDKLRALEEYRECGRWLDRIIELNSQRKAFDTNHLREQLSRRYFELCYANPQLGPSAMSVYAGSLWSSFSSPSWQDRVKYKMKLLLNV